MLVGILIEWTGNFVLFSVSEFCDCAYHGIYIGMGISVIDAYTLGCQIPSKRMYDALSEGTVKFLRNVDQGCSRLLTVELQMGICIDPSRMTSQQASGGQFRFAIKALERYRNIGCSEKTLSHQLFLSAYKPLPFA